MATLPFTERKEWFRRWIAVQMQRSGFAIFLARRVEGGWRGEDILGFDGWVGYLLRGSALGIRGFVGLDDALDSGMVVV